MARFSPLAWFLRTPNDSRAKTLVVALGVSLVCSVMVATSVVLLRPLHEANRAREQQSRFGEILALMPAAAEGSVPLIEPRVIALEDGRPVAGATAEDFDAVAEARDPARSVALAPDTDIAGLKRRANRAVVYFVRRRGRLEMVVLPVSGRGYGAIMRGYLGLSGDTETVIGLVFYEHQETPGLGAQIDSPAWRAQWRGKKVWGADGKPALAVAPSRITPEDPRFRHQVDALTGATWTSQGVTNMLRFWLGELGFAPLLRRIRDGDVK